MFKMNIDGRMVSKGQTIIAVPLQKVYKLLAVSLVEAHRYQIKTRINKSFIQKCCKWKIGKCHLEIFWFLACLR